MRGFPACRVEGDAVDVAAAALASFPARAHDRFPSMKRRIVLCAFALLVCSGGISMIGAQEARGALVVVGGGGTTDAIVARTLQLAGGKDAIVAVLPQSSAVANAGDSSVKMWLDAGAKSASKVLFDDRAKARAALEAATLIWMPGGDQNRFMKAIDGTGLAEVIHARYRAGAVVGGTSAGAAVLSEAMITGEADLKSLTAGKTVLGAGLGLLTDVIVDQHFLQRQRGNRLISAVLDRPALVGIGIDEATAVIFRGSSFEVVGKSSVVVV